MSSQQGDPPIIISGGSVTIDFDKALFQQQADGKHRHADKKISRIEINGDGINFAEDTKTGKVTVKIYFKDKDK
ncbi:MAG TPA: hypothetical protein VM936_00970 [Pyrinomonadaceae bacterium]|nr:hypothetical protein [Pyrinomonadaceae bacterium]